MCICEAMIMTLVMDFVYRIAEWDGGFKMI